MVDERVSYGAKVTVRVEPNGLKSFNERLGRYVAHEVACDLGREVARRGGVHREVSEYGHTLVDAAVRVAFTEDALSAWLVCA